MTDQPAHGLLAEGDGPVQQVVVGRVGKPFGVKGDVYVFADPDLADPFDEGVTYSVATSSRRLTVARSRMHGDRLVVAFEGSHAREDAEELRGLVLTRARSQVALEPDMIWVDDLIGRQVIDADGGLVGVVLGVADGHAHDYLIVARPDGGEAVVPMVAELLDWTVDPITVQSLPGLLDPDKAL
ncbi:MAG: ribosome maturation factor RimM [Euzebya sp.]